MTVAVVVRPASATQHEDLRGLVQAAGLPLAGLESVVARFVAERHGEVVGVAALEQHVDERGDVFLLRSVAVRTGFRGQGIGEGLTRAALQHVDAHGGPVALLTETAADFFPRFGFVEVLRADLPTALLGSAELQGACAVSARAFLRAARRPAS